MPNNFDALGYYRILGLPTNADISQIKRSYYEKAKYWHPDHNEKENALDIFQQISVAYDTLKDVDTRLMYDLLCCIYTNKDFPLIGSLKVYKNQSEKDDKSLRVLKQRKIVKGKIEEHKDICNYKEACNMVFSTSVYNWLCGWWNLKNFAKNINVIKFNLRAAEAKDADNFKLLLHNALAYKQENNVEMAWIYAKQAALLTAQNSHQENLLKQFITRLDYRPTKRVNLLYWNSQNLKFRQHIFPIFLVLCLTLMVMFAVLRTGIFAVSKTKISNYYEERIIGDSIRPSDMVENKIFKVDSGVNSTENLAHLKIDCPIYYGPDERYDILQQGTQNQTLRITGYTTDKKWYQVLIDNGEKGFVHKNNLEQGIGNPIPEKSHVYRRH